MKTILACILALLLFIPTLMLAQEKTYQLKESQLTEEQKTQLRNTNVIGESTGWIGFGKEVGQAMKEGLAALNEEVNKFSQSDAGHFTMFVIAYHVMGKDLLHAAFGTFFTAVFFVMFSFFYYRNCVTRKVLIEKSGTLFSTKVKKYQVVNDPNTYSDLDSTRALHGLVFVLVLLIMIAVTFSGC